LAACEKSSSVPDNFHTNLTDHTRRHPIVVVAETATLDVALVPNGPGQEARAFVETTRFARNYRQEAKGPLYIALPRRSGQNRAVSQRVRAIRQVMARAGIPSHRIKTYGKGHHDAREDAITLSYDRIAAVGPTCGDWSEDITRNPENLPYPNFGCAAQRNLAAMVANPTDLMFPAQEDDRLGDKRSTDYRKAISGASGGGGGGGGAGGAGGAAPARP
jgi:pilus assembly protein CpaD